MAKKSKLKIHNIGAFVIGLFFLACCIIGLVTTVVEYATQNSHGFEISEKFYVSSTQNAMSNPKFKTKIVGRIKNNNDYDAENIVLHIEVETWNDEKTATAKITIPFIKAGEEYYVNVSEQSEYDYQLINNIFIQIGNNPKEEIVYDGESILYTLIGFVPMMIIPTFLLRAALHGSKFKKDKDHDEEIAELKAEMERKIKKLKKATKGVKCEYCGLLNKVDATRCEGCGATVEYNNDEL